MRYVFMVLVFSSSILSAQGILRLGTIEYSVINENRVPISKTTFEYDNHDRVTVTTSFRVGNGDLNRALCINRRVRQEYDSKGKVSKTFSTFYDENGDCIAPKISFYSEVENEELINGERETRLESRYDNDGTLSWYFGRRRTSYKNEDGCVETALIENSFDKNDNRKWHVSNRFEFKLGRNCLRTSTEGFDQLNNRTSKDTVILDALGNETFRENISYNTEGDISNINQTESIYDRLGRRTLQVNKTENFSRESFSELRVRWIYSDRADPDSIIYHYFSPEGESKTLETFTYYEDGRLRKRSSFNYHEQNLDSLIFYGSNENIYISDNHRKHINCIGDEPCATNEYITSREEEENRIITSTINNTYLDDVLVESRTDRTEIDQWCNGAERERRYYNNDILTSVVESYYGVVPSCELRTLDENSIVIPNPVTDGFSIWSSLLNGLETQIVISDLSGRVISSITTKKREHYRIDTDGWSQGVYFISLQRGDLTVCKRMVLV